MPVLVVTLLLSAGLHAVSAFTNRRIDHDDAISYLAATGHQDGYGWCVRTGAFPYGRWVPAREWKRFTRVEDRFVFGRIGQDLSHTDIHPPLYFWALHVWCLIVGVHGWTGPTLNLLIHALTALVVYRIARHISGSRTEALAATALWGLSSAVVSAELHTRAYCLFGLWTVLMLDQAIHYVQEPARTTRAAALGALILAGLLTHYQFVIVVVGMLGFLLVRSLQTRSAHFLALLPALIPAVAALLLAQPCLGETLARQRGEAQPFDLSRLPDRALTIGRSLGEFVVPEFSNPAAWAAASLFYLVLTVALVSVIRRGRPAVGFEAVLSFLAVLGLAVSASYLLFLSPDHAMGDRYMEPLWPLLALFTVHGVASSRGCLRTVMAGGIVASVATGFVLLSMTTFSRLSNDPTSVFADADRVLIDNTSRGTLPALVWHIPDATPVLAASQKDLLNERGWLDGAIGRTVYISHLDYRSSAAGRDAIAKILESKRGRPVSPEPWDGGLEASAYVFPLGP